MPSHPEIVVGADHEAASRAAADHLARLAAAATRERNRCVLVLSGGKTPRRAYEHLANSDVVWSRVHLLWGDERCVPPADPRSNYRLVEEGLLSRLPAPPAQVHRIEGERNPEDAARRYEDVVATHAPADAALLGVGEDGHTASLFPFDPALWTRRPVVAVTAPPAYDPRVRVTMTLPPLRLVRHVVFLVTGEAKRTILHQLIEESAASALVYPAAMITGTASTTWFVDRAAWPSGAA